jgi:hypothetical protein
MVRVFRRVRITAEAQRRRGKRGWETTYKAQSQKELETKVEKLK